MMELGNITYPRFTISEPYHGEIKTIWYIYDNEQDEVIGSINQKGEIRTP
jgi:hypothetical protein